MEERSHLSFLPALLSPSAIRCILLTPSGRLLTTDSTEILQSDQKEQVSVASGEQETFVKYFSSFFRVFLVF